VGIKIGRINVQLDHLIEPCANGFQAFLEILEYLSGLSLNVTLSHNIPIFINRGLASNVNVVPALHNLSKSGPRVPKACWLYRFWWHLYLLQGNKSQYKLNHMWGQM
jgi:hypothetical protein